MIGTQPCDQSSGPHAIPPNRTFDRKRIIPALIFIPLFYGLVRYLPPLVFFGLVTIVAGLALFEFLLLFDPAGSSKSTICVSGLAGILLLISQQWPHLIPLQVSLGLGILLIVSVHVLSPSGPSGPALSMQYSLFGVLYVEFTLGHLLSIRLLPEGEFLIFFVILVTWAGDTGAYFTGKLLGRRPLAPRLSPNKTVEGLVGGLILAFLGATLAHFWFLPSLTLNDTLLTGVLLTLAGVIGDLSESAFKRHVGIKDSGNLIPGHGGMLDRLDSLLLTAPTFYYYMLWVKA